MDPDITITVGRGEKLKEFRCFKSELVFASDYFDAILSEQVCNTKEAPKVEFADDDPEDWPLVYGFINPKTIRGAKITESNISRLMPWFHKLQMADLLTECDHTFFNKIPEKACDQVFWEEAIIVDSSGSGSDKRRSCLDHILNFLALSSSYSLKETGEKSATIISVALKAANYLFCLEDFLKLQEYLKYSPHSFNQIWEELKTYLPGDMLLKDLSKTKIVENDLFAYFVFSEIKNRAQEKKRNNELQLIDQERKKMKKTMNVICYKVLQFPNLMYQQMPFNKPRGEDVNFCARNKMRKVIHGSFKEDDWIKVPSNWSYGGT
mmetsp:Transcript_36400/g.85101  ORF Transcript_36400/g.85101 Transcript_36400/m.85101 type:complete len:322 (-) Transcript_36400:86-1051(-)